MKTFLLSLLVTLVYVGNYNHQPVYVNPDDVSGLQAVGDLGFSSTAIKLKMGNEVYSNWYPQQIMDALNKANSKGK
jgi:hypothetical protein